MMLDFSKKKTPLVPLIIAGEVVEEVKAFKIFGTTISCDLKRDENISSAVKKAHQRFFFLRQVKKLKVSHSTLSHFYRAASEIIPVISHHCLVQQLVSKGQRTREDSPHSLYGHRHAVT